LNKIAQLKQRRLENEQALLQLRRENLLESKTLCLLHSLRDHTPSLTAWAAMSKLCRGRRAACGHRIAAGTAAATRRGCMLTAFRSP